MDENQCPPFWTSEPFAKHDSFARAVRYRIVDVCDYILLVVAQLNLYSGCSVCLAPCAFPFGLSARAVATMLFIPVYQSVVSTLENEATAVRAPMSKPHTVYRPRSAKKASSACSMVAEWLIPVSRHQATNRPHTALSQ